MPSVLWNHSIFTIWLDPLKVALDLWYIINFKIGQDIIRGEGKAKGRFQIFSEGWRKKKVRSLKQNWENWYGWLSLNFGGIKIRDPLWAYSYRFESLLKGLNPLKWAWIRICSTGWHMLKILILLSLTSRQNINFICILFLFFMIVD